MAYEALHEFAKANNLDLLSALEQIDENPDAVADEVRCEARQFLYGGSKMFAPIGLTDDEIERRAMRRVAHFDV